MQSKVLRHLRKSARLSGKVANQLISGTGLIFSLLHLSQEIWDIKRHSVMPYKISKSMLLNGRKTTPSSKVNPNLIISKSYA